MGLSFFKPLAKYVPAEFQQEFHESIIEKNFIRAVFISNFAPIVLFLIALPDLFNILYSKGSSYYNYFGIYTNISLLICVFLWIIAYKICGIDKSIKQKLRLTKGILFPLTSLITVYASLIHNVIYDSTAFYIVLYGNILFFDLPGFSQIFFHIISYLIMLSFCAFGDSDYIRANNSIQILSISFILSSTYWRLRRNYLASEFMNKKRYELEKDKVHRLNLELIESNENLEKLNRDKNDFLGIAAHDLKNPLMNIKMASEMIYLEMVKDKSNIIYELGKDINRVAQNMFELINNYLDVNKIESGKLSIKPVGMCLYDLLNNTYVRFSESAKQKNIEIEFLNFESPLMIYSDIFLLKQVFDNILSNAIKYSEYDKKIQVKLNKNEDYKINVSIKDFGQGISEEDQNNLFQKFKKLSSIPTAGEDSTGLGLFIVKKLLDNLGGTIWCKSELGNGSEFFVELPKRYQIMKSV